MELTCTNYKCVIEEETFSILEESFKNSLSTWWPGNSSQFWGITLQDARREKLGAEEPLTSAATMVGKGNHFIL